MLTLQKALSKLSDKVIAYQLEKKTYYGRFTRLFSSVPIVVEEQSEGYLRSVKFLHAVKAQQFNQTTDLVKFVLSYKDKGTLLKRYIWDALREICGFNHAHVNYLADRYSKTKKQSVYAMPITYDSSECQDTAKEFIEQAICGKYKLQLKECLSALRLSKKNFNKWEFDVGYYAEQIDYGQQLLQDMAPLINIENYDNGLLYDPREQTQEIPLRPVQNLKVGIPLNVSMTVDELKDSKKLTAKLNEFYQQFVGRGDFAQLRQRIVADFVRQLQKLEPDEQVRAYNIAYQHDLLREHRDLTEIREVINDAYEGVSDFFRKLRHTENQFFVQRDLIETHAQETLAEAMAMKPII